ncbi:MAG: hypothetical protein NTV15_03225 [Candidatus Bathyarchaeota archaeon]|nr:hypothetical protein [Candidatus Bathyarchaeota archaeon]
MLKKSLAAPPHRSVLTLLLQPARYLLPTKPHHLKLNHLSIVSWIRVLKAAYPWLEASTNLTRFPRDCFLGGKTSGL